MDLDGKTVKRIAPDLLAPAEIEQKLEEISVTRTSFPPFKSIILGILAGMFIAIGGLLFTLVLSDATIPFIAQRLVGGLAFSIGLVLVLTAGAELFTGNNLIIMATLSGKVSGGALIKNLIIVWLANLVGSLIVVVIVFFANIGSLNGGAVSDAFINLAAMKTSLPLVSLFFRGVLCNFLVCLAIWMATGGRSFVDKFLAAIFPVTAFIAVGAEHSVANMFLLPMGLAEKLAGHASSDAAMAAADKIDIPGILCNLGMVSLGNMVGGMILVGLLYWLAYRKKKAQ